MALEILNPDNTINLRYFGAAIDGKEDDSNAWDAAIAYATNKASLSNTIKAPNGVSRITRPIVIGGQFIDIERLFNKIDISTLDPAGFAEYLKGTRCINMQIVGETKSCIYADFNDATKMKAAIYVGGMQGRSAAGFEQYNVEISNIGIYAQGYFVGGKRNTAKVDYSQNNCAGIISVCSQGVTLDRLTLYGFKEGEVHNQDYFFESKKVTTWYCKRASFDIGSHNSSYIMARNYYCTKGIEVRSNKMFLDRPYSLGCVTGLHIAGSDNIINLAYLESSLQTDGQLIIGDEPTDVNAYKGTVDGVIFNSLTIAGSYPARVGILCKSNVRTFEIDGGALQSQYFNFNNPATKVIVQNVLGNLPLQNVLKHTYNL